MNDTQSIIEIADEFNLNGSLSYLDDLIVKRAEGMSFFSAVFMDIFNIEDNILKTISYSSNLYFWSLLINDKLMDDNSCELSKESLLLSHVLREKSLRGMYDIFPPKHKYWSFFDAYTKEYVSAVVLESNKHFGKLEEFTIGEAEKIYSGNAAIAKAVTTAMAFYANKEELIPYFECSIDNFHIGKNIEDDVWDWKSDFKNQQYSYLLTNVILKSDLQLRLNNLSIDELGKYIFFSGFANDILVNALSYYGKAKNNLKDIDCKGWKFYIDKSIKECFDLKDQLSVLVDKQLIISDNTKNEIQISYPKPTNIIQDIKIEAVKYIYNQCQSDFIEASNNQYFKNMNGLTFNQNYHVSDVFQRAIIAEILIDANMWLRGQINNIIGNEVDYLIKSRISDRGWNFYPTLELQPSDTDTTAQVLQVLIKSGKTDIAKKLGDAPIELLLTERYNEDGSFGTWLIPRKNCNSKDLQCISFFIDYCNINIIDNKDTEVIANMLYTLYLLDHIKYEKIIAKGIEYLISIQNKHGYWKSSWYYGPLYGTYLCFRLISILDINNHSLEIALNYIKDNQNNDGGWGDINKNSDPLNTSFALICLSYYKEKKYKDIEAMAERGFNYLINSKFKEGGWPKCDFINLLKNTNSIFRSKTITTAYVLKASICWEKQSVSHD